VEEMKKVGVKLLQEDKYQVEEYLVLKERKLYVLKYQNQRQ